MQREKKDHTSLASKNVSSLSKTDKKLAGGARKKFRGIFYTPTLLSQILSDWAIRNSQDTVLEPSFGGCVFIAAVIDRLTKLGNRAPVNQIYGCDLDPKAFLYLKELFGEYYNPYNFIKKDFLKTNQTSFQQSKFDVVIGNPPYVSRYNMLPTQKASVAAFIKEYAPFFSQRASLWAFFAIHAVHYLKPQGRLAFVLPGSVLNAHYGHLLLKYLGREFNSVTIASLRERLFISDGTDESTEILLCEDKLTQRKEPASSPNIVGVETLQELRMMLDNPQILPAINVSLEGRYHRFFKDNSELKLYQDIVSSCHAVELSKFARVSIGIVTGANNFFVINRSKAISCKLAYHKMPRIFAKFKSATGTEVIDTDIKGWEQDDERCIFVTTDQMRHVGPLRRYLNTFPTDERKSNSTFKKRGKWFSPGDTKIPDAFIPYMHHLGPRIVLNTAKINCTNTIHRMYFKQSLLRSEMKLLSISILSTFSQLSSEIVGRTYGSGVLKHEPSEAGRIMLVIPPKVEIKDVNRTFDAIDTLLRVGSYREATSKADELLSNYISHPVWQTALPILKAALLNARSLRVPPRGNAY